MLSLQGCKKRTQRLLAWCKEHEVDLAVISNEKEIYYFTNFLRKPFGWLTTRHALLGCFSDATTILVCSESEKRLAQDALASHLAAYMDYDIETTTQTFIEQALLTFREAIAKLNKSVKRIAIEKRYAPVALREVLELTYPEASFIDVADALQQMRKQKDQDEVELLRRTAALSGFCYDTAAAEISPGKKDIDIYAACYEAYARKMGEYVVFAGDYLAGEDTLKVSGGPTGRLLESGQTMILDLWIDPYGYWVDSARTFMIGNKPSAEQERLYELAIKAIRQGEKYLKPGVKGKDVYYELRKVFEREGLAQYFPGHAGHGIGLSPHEAPLFIPGSSDTIEAGDVCALEPGLYVPGIGGVRCEDNYFITGEGPQRLTNFRRKIR